MLDLHRRLRRRGQPVGPSASPAASSPGSRPNWGWAWPANRRTLYNRASADPDGKPWSERKAYHLVGRRRGQVDRARRTRLRPRSGTAPSYRPVGTAPVRPKGLAGDDAFIMQADGKAWLYAPAGAAGRADAVALRAAASRPCSNPFYRQQANPTRQVFKRTDNLQNPSGDDPRRTRTSSRILFTTYRLTEHHTAGGMSRWLPYLAQSCNRSSSVRSHPRWPRLNAAWTHHGLGDDHQLPGPRSRPGCMVTDRVVAATQVGGRTSSTRSACPITGGSAPRPWCRGDSANDLFGVTLDANVHIQESKVASCDIQPGRRPTGPALAELCPAQYQAPGRHHRSRPGTSSGRRRAPTNRPAPRRRRAD